jgi:hypothetical protein
MVSSLPPGRVSPAVHADEDQHDERKDDDDEHAGAGEVVARRPKERYTRQRHLAPTE